MTPVKLLLTISSLNTYHPICITSYGESVVTEDEPDVVLFVIDVLSSRSAQFNISVVFLFLLDQRVCCRIVSISILSELQHLLHATTSHALQHFRNNFIVKEGKAEYSLKQIWISWV